MDMVFISKVSIIVVLYFLTDYVYKKTEWHTNRPGNFERPIAQTLNNFLIKVFKKNLDDVLIFIYVIFWGLPLFLSVVLLGFIIVFQGTLKFLDSRNYWEQIVICFGFIALYFSIRIYLDGEKIKNRQKDSLIETQRKAIIELQEKISMMEKSRIALEKGQ